MKLGKRILLCLIGAVVLFVLIQQVYIHLHFRLFRDYKDSLTLYAERENGTPFAPLADSGAAPEGFLLGAENEFLKLYIAPATGEVAVWDKRSGKLTRSNPEQAAADPLANGQNKAILQSQLIVEFYNQNRLAGLYDSHTYAAAMDNQIAVDSLANGLRVTYTLGDTGSKTGIVPLYISAERLESFLSKLDAAKARYVRARYLESKTAPGFLELNENARTGAGQLRNLNSHLAEAGYTAADYQADMEASGAEAAAPISFVVPVEYRLEGDSLLASIPAREIQENGGGRIFRIQLLRFFGAAGTDETGYIMVPNASGSLIYFNNGKTCAEDYAQYIYGMDPLISDFVVLGNAEDARLPYFGLHREGQTMLATLEDGDSLAIVSAAVSGKLNSYNSVYPTFVTRGASSLRMFGATGNEAELPIVERELITADLRVRYSFLDSAHEGYAGMASYAREALQQKGFLNETKTAGDIPLYLDALGAARGTKFFLGARYEGIVPMTTYEQAADITKTLQAAGVNNQVMNFQGWFNRGYYHDAPDKLRPVAALGGKKDMESLSALLESGGGKLYLDAALQAVTFSSRHFAYAQETSRYYAGGYAAFGLVHPTTLRRTASLGYRDVLHDLLSPKFLPRYTDSLLRGMERFDVTGLSLRDLGGLLHSDRKRTEIIGREEALDVVLAALDKCAAADKDLMTASPNLYAALRSDDVLNLPLAHNDFYIADEEIPFYQMLLHGSVDYAGLPLNLSEAGGEAEIIARLVEFGASPHFTFSYEDTSEMKYTSLFYKYSTSWENWNERAVRIYKAVNEALAPVRGARMTGHEILPNGLRRVSYDNGLVIYVNRTDTALTAEGMTLDAFGYMVGGNRR